VTSKAINPLSLRSDDVNASSIWNNNKFPIGNQTIVYINRIKRSISTDLVNISGQLMSLKISKVFRDLVNRYGISVSQMTTDMFYLS
jgi:hypothetical protein